jgi:hypothetical protein
MGKAIEGPPLVRSRAPPALLRGAFYPGGGFPGSGEKGGV